MADILAWLPQIFGTRVGTGNGTRLDREELIRTGQVITSWELLEMSSATANNEEFHINFFYLIPLRMRPRKEQ